MFRKKPTAPKAGTEGATAAPAPSRGARRCHERGLQLVYLAWLAAALLRAGPAPDELARPPPGAATRSQRGRHGDRRRRDARLPDPRRARSPRPAGSSSSSASLIGGGAGLYTARTVKMTAMPQLVSLFNAVGGGAAALVAIDDSRCRVTRRRRAGRHDDLRRPRRAHRLGHVHRLAHRRRQAPGPHPGQADHRPGRPAGQRWRLAVVAVGAAALHARHRPACPRCSSCRRWPALVFGVTMVLPIGGADMPVVISLLNSFTGTAVAMAGFVLGNPVLIIAGALVGASGRDPDQAHGRRDEPLDDQHHGRRLRRRRRRGRGRRRPAAPGPRDRGRRRGDPARLRPAR